MASKALPAQDVLLQLLSYDPDTGKLFWLRRGPEWFKDGAQSREHNAAIWNGKNAGKEAFVTRLPTGHRYAGLFGVKTLAHRVIWKMVTGEEPDTIDHINGDASDNRWANLRNVTQADNARNCRRSKNNSSGFNGIYWSRRHGKWCVDIHFEYRKKHIGLFSCIGKAVVARRAAEKAHGFHENHGRAA